ncbi:MAG: hypothetical protein J6Q30_03425 [Oscillospiraceae bacterium]|nr:hypothetical protein [Oscillospiraceae bacterium]
MDNFEDKLNSVLANPQMMSQIMAMAQSLGQSNQGSEAPPHQEPSGSEKVTQQVGPSMFNLDSDALQKIFSATQQTGIDKNQQGLLRALSPYLCQSRISKLEKAMRAAKIAGFAAAALNSKGKGW